MKTILRIISILLVASAIAGAFLLTVNNGSIASSLDEGGQPPALTGSDGQSTTQPMPRPEGGEPTGGSITQGLFEVLGTLVKLTGITIIVLLLQKVPGVLGKRRSISTQR